MLRPASRCARKHSLTCTTPVPHLSPPCLKSSGGLGCSFRVHQHICSKTPLAATLPPPADVARHTPLRAASQLGVAGHSSLLRFSGHRRALSSTSGHVGGDKRKRVDEDARTAAGGGASLPELKGVTDREGEREDDQLEKASPSYCLVVPTAVVEGRTRNWSLSWVARTELERMLVMT